MTGMRNNKKFTGYYMPVELLIRFQRLYPRLQTTFIRRCLIRACDNKDFFDKVFFSTYDQYSDLGANNPKYQDYDDKENLEDA